MNKKQKIVILMGVIALNAMILYPPWVEYFPNTSNRGDYYFSVGYHFIMKPPRKLVEKKPDNSLAEALGLPPREKKTMVKSIYPPGFSIDTKRLYVQILGVFVTASGFWLIFYIRKPKKATIA